MTTNQPLSLFISSTMAELAEERRAVQSALSAYQMRGWLFEQDAGARPEPIQSTYLTEVEACDIYTSQRTLRRKQRTICRRKKGIIDAGRLPRARHKRISRLPVNAVTSSIRWRTSTLNAIKSLPLRSFTCSTWSRTLPWQRASWTPVGAHSSTSSKKRLRELVIG